MARWCTVNAHVAGKLARSGTAQEQIAVSGASSEELGTDELTAAVAVAVVVDKQRLDPSCQR